jgi:hypothetical protein
VTCPGGHHQQGPASCVRGPAAADGRHKAERAAVRHLGATRPCSYRWSRLAAQRAHRPAFVCDTPHGVGIWHSHSSGISGAQGREHDHDLHPSDEAARDRRQKSNRSQPLWMKRAMESAQVSRPGDPIAEGHLFLPRDRQPVRPRSRGRGRNLKAAWRRPPIELDYNSSRCGYTFGYTSCESGIALGCSEVRRPIPSRLRFGMRRLANCGASRDGRARRPLCPRNRDPWTRVVPREAS